MSNNNNNAWYGQMGFGPEVTHNQHKPNGGSADSTMPPPPQRFQHGNVSGSPAPWMNLGQDMDYSNLGDGFAQAFDMTLQNPAETFGRKGPICPCWTHCFNAVRDMQQCVDG